jgi:DNA-binding IclR family transcriptional regulator
LRSTALGKALILDESKERLRELYDAESKGSPPYGVSFSTWLKRMRKYAKLGYALDLEENEDRIRCVAASIRDAAGQIKAAISISSAAQYMDNKRMQNLAKDICHTAMQISHDLGWNGTRHIS